MDEKDRIPAHFPTPQGISREGPQRHILMTPHMVAIGGLLAFFSVVLMVVVLPLNTYNPPPSTNWLPLSNSAIQGMHIYLQNGCFYCHSGYVRPQDTFTGLYYLYPRIAEPGDFYGEEGPNLFGTERTGPDLSQEGGNHPDQWHAAHYWNARAVNPFSIMPIFSFFSPQELTDTIAFNQAQGGKEALLRNAAMRVGLDIHGASGGDTDPAAVFPGLVSKAKQSGTYHANGTPDDTDVSGLSWGNIGDLMTFERSYWLTRDPLEPTFQNLNEGRRVFEQRCVGCHGATGLGDGPAAKMLNPKPDNFSDPGMYSSPTDSDGERYHRILTGGRGSAMENFGTRLSVQDVWRVVLFLRVVPTGGFSQTVTTVDKYKAWEAPPELANFAKTHPATAPGLPPLTGGQKDPFMAAAQWIFGGLAPGESFLLGGKLPITLDDVAELVKTEYTKEVEQAYRDAAGRGEQLPAKAELLSMEGVVFQQP